MDAGLLDMLHDAGNVDGLAVRDGVDVNLDRVLEVGIDEHRVVARNLDGGLHVAVERVAVVDDLHGPAAEHVGRAQQHRVADPVGHGLRLGERMGDAVGGLAQLELMQELLEALAVLGQVDGVGRGPEDGDVRRLERGGELERRLAAELHDDPQELSRRLLGAHDLDHVLGRKRLEIEAVGGVVVGRDGLGVAVDHDGLVPRLLEAVDRVDAAIVELDALADAVRSAAEDDDLAAAAHVGFGLGRGEAVALIGRVHIGRL